MITVRRGADTAVGRRSYDVEVDHDADRAVWWETIEGDPIPVDDRMDAGALALLPMAMNYRQDLHVAGPVSWTLLANLVDVVDAWCAWRPDLFGKVAITADEVVDDRADGPGAAAGKTVFGFSGGVDSTFVAYAHANGLLGLQSCEPVEAILVHGFDIPAGDLHGYELAAAGARDVTAEMGVPFTAVRTNWREVVDPAGWEVSFGQALGATLHLFADRAAVATIASDNTYATLAGGWGSNPITSPLMSSARMRVRYTAAGWGRTAKCAHIATLDSVRRNLRVCWQGDVPGANCTRCEKCIRTKINLLGAGAGVIPALGPIRPGELESLNVPSKAALGLYLELLESEDDLEPHVVAALKAAVAASPFDLA
ncbi:MAG: hypothetical protein U0P45_15465 [Acidimicrobiales bacterium]